MSSDCKVVKETMPELRATILSWITGFWEGEGCLVFDEPKCDVFIVRLYLSQTNKEILEWVRQQMYGFGKVRKGWESGWSLIVNKQKEVLTWLREILPYLRIERNKAKAQLAIQFLESRLSVMGFHPYELNELKLVKTFCEISRQTKKKAYQSVCQTIRSRENER